MYERKSVAASRCRERPPRRSGRTRNAAEGVPYSASGKSAALPAADDGLVAGQAVGEHVVARVEAEVAVGVQREDADARAVVAEDADLVAAVAVPVADDDRVVGQPEVERRVAGVQHAVAVGVEDELADAADVAEHADV